MIRRLLLATSSLLLLAGAGPVTRELTIPAREGVPAHAVRVLIWTPPADPAALLVYQPSWGGSADENSRLSAVLSAEGYFVAAIDYAVTQPGDFAQVTARMKTPMDLSSMDGLARTIKEGDWRVVLMASDTTSVIDQLPEAQGLKLGIFGWSFGGAVALQTCQQDRRFTASANMDGWMFGPAADHPSPQPYMLMSGSAYPAEDERERDPSVAMDNRDAARLRARMAEFGGIFVQITGATHADFSGRRAVYGAVPTLLKAFFGHALLGVPAPMLEEAQPMAGIRLTRFARPGAPAE